MKRLPMLYSLLAVIALSASIAYWGMQLYKPAQRPLAVSAPVAVAEPAPDAAATLFGGQAVAVVATNYQLTGVVSAGRLSVAILVADGQPPMALRIGKEIAPGVSVSEVHPRYVMLSEGGILKRIELATDTKTVPNMAPPIAGAMPPPMQGQPPPTPAPMPVQMPPSPPPQTVQPQPYQPQVNQQINVPSEAQQQGLPQGMPPQSNVPMGSPARNFNPNPPAEQ
jgi:general secretion pathway protein C